MASKFTSVVVFSLVLFLIFGANTLVMAHGDAGAAAGGAVPAGAATDAAAGGAAPAGGAAAGAPGAAATFADQSGVMDAGAAGLGAGAPARRR